MRQHVDRPLRMLVGFVGPLGVALATTMPTSADTTQPAPPAPAVALGMTLPEYQGWGCLIGGGIAATGVFVYSDAITVAATGMVNPVLLIPVMATGFAVGCGVGATGSPAFLWLGRALGGR